MKGGEEKALLSQDACNASGIIKSLAEIVDAVWDEAKMLGQGTDFVNSHPVIRLLAEQIMWLSKDRDYCEAYRICEEKADRN